MTTRLWLVRHGETAWSAAGRLNGWRDLSLSDRGRAQARALADRLRGRRFHAIWSSDLRRAIETARLAYGEPNVDRRLRELDFGALEGRTWQELDEPTRCALIDFEGFEASDGESVASMRSGVMSFVGDLEAGDHLVFTHGGVIRLLMRATGTDRSVSPGEFVVMPLGAGWHWHCVATSPSCSAPYDRRMRRRRRLDRSGAA
jgi:probable phosphoglycerate mutase